jgi:hypothetical protein
LKKEKEMRNLGIILLVVLSIFLFSCKRGKTIRQIFRSASRASQVEDKEKKEKSKDYLLKYTRVKDSAGKVHYRAHYLLPEDTSMFFMSTSYNMPEALDFDSKLDSCSVKAFFYKASEDTLNENYSLTKTFHFRKTEEFYNIEER